MTRFSLLTALLLLITSSYLSAQGVAPAVNGSKSSTSAPKLNVLVKGQVLDSLTNETLPYATLKISAKESPEKPVKLLATDDAGKFEFAMDRAGDYLLTAQFVGKKPFVKPFVISETEREVNLEKITISDNQLLEEVVITAFKPLVKVDLDKITYSTEDDPDSKTSNVLDMLRKVPLVTVDAEDKIELKGSSGFKIYMDGKPSNLISNNPTQVLRNMPANTVKNIEVITDPGAKYDAEGVTGIINIITNKQPLGGYTATVNAGATSTGGYNGGINATIKYGKFGFSGAYNYNHHRSPSSPSEMYMENLIPAAEDPANEKYQFQNGSSQFDGNFQFGYGELSYEIDTLNLLSASFNRFGGTGDSKSNMKFNSQNVNRQDLSIYERNSESENTFGSTDFNVDYQRTFKKKDELLTASYKFSVSPNDSYTNSRIDSVFNSNNSWRISDNDASDKEHTFQLDYTTPIAKIHTIEGGAKYIIRLNESNSDHNLYNFSSQEWMNIQTDNDRFKYRYDIAAGYLGYNLRYKDYGFKTGMRFENTQIAAEYPLNSKQNFDNEYFTWVPSATLTYRFKQIHNFRLGYNLRMQRPGIWFLNPYINTTDPQNISQGNPDLDVEKAHNVGLNYSMFKPKFNLNAGLNYNFINNSIQRVTYLREYADGESYNYSTYENIGKQNRTSFDLYLNWNPTTKFRFYVNGSASYTDIRANDNSGMANSGFDGRLFGNIQYNLPKDFRVTLNGGGGSQRISLQGESSGFYFTGIGINKSFMKNKLNISLNGSNLFEKYISFWSVQRSNDFYTRNDNKYVARNVSIRISYQFGEMKQQISKARRGINNDDTKSGEGNSQSGGSGGGTGGGQ